VPHAGHPSGQHAGHSVHPGHQGQHPGHQGQYPGHPHQHAGMPASEDELLNLFS